MRADTMHDGLFELVFDGRLLPGRDPAEVKTNVAHLFKAQVAQIERLFSGSEVVIKKQLDYPGALRYAAALKQAGALCRIRPMGEAAATPTPSTQVPLTRTASGDATPPTPAASPAPATTTGADEALVLAPVGADLLDSYRHDAPPPPDTSHLSVANLGADLLEGMTRTPPPPTPNTSHLSVAEPGAELNYGQTRAQPPAPDVSHLSVAEVGADLSDGIVRPPVVEPDTSHLSLSPDDGETVH